MAVTFTDTQITELLAENKPVSAADAGRLQTRRKRGHRERELNVCGANGTEFRLILRQADINPLDFSVILAVLPQSTTTLFRLIRLNGKSHEHTNRLERETFYDFHVHRATERYQEAGMREDSFAEPTGAYSTFDTALDLMLRSYGFNVEPAAQGHLFQ